MDKIIGIGIDILENKRIKKKLAIFTHVLNNFEIEIFTQIKNKKQKIEFLASRWAAKEAIIKAYSTKISMNDINLVFNYEKQVMEVYIKNNLNTSLFLSISHEKKYSIAVAILNKKNANKI